MTNCLGLYIEDNLIKYAKVSKDHDNIKVDSFGVKFYDNLHKAIRQVLEETYSFKIPICVNLSEESYNYFDMFGLLNKKDMDQAIKTEFESYCTDKGYNPNVFETRYAFVNHLEDKEKIKVIHISSNKIELNKKEKEFEEYRLSSISPLPMCIANIADVDPKQNAIIVNMEEKTSIVSVIDQKIYNIDQLEQGSGEVLRKINLKENSYAKAYEICKNTTIYTSEGLKLQEQTESSYLDDIMPTLYNIVGQLQKIINEMPARIEKIYLTGTLALVNNVDLYFQEYLSDIKCEILKPYFIENQTSKINIKDYIEVNSAIALAMQGIDEGISGMNFKKKTLSDSIPDWLRIETKSDKNKKKSDSPVSKLFKFDLNEKLDKIETNLLRGAVSLLILFIVYSGFSVLLNNQIQSKKQEAEDSISNTNSQIALIDSDMEKIKTKTNQYTTMINNLQEMNEKISDINSSKKSIPNLLNTIMFSIPKNVQITSIENTVDKHIEIYAQSDKYEQLGYLIAVIKSDNILSNVISTAGQKDGGVVTVKIEGDLP